jgi:hypothetical protein
VDGLIHLMTLRAQPDAIDRPQGSKKERVTKIDPNKMVHCESASRNTPGTAEVVACPEVIRLADAAYASVTIG